MAQSVESTNIAEIKNKVNQRIFLTDREKEIYRHYIEEETKADDMKTKMNEPIHQEEIASRIFDIKCRMKRKNKLTERQKEIYRLYREKEKEVMQRMKDDAYNKRVICQCGKELYERYLNNHLKTQTHLKRGVFAQFKRVCAQTTSSQPIKSETVTDDVIPPN